MSLIGIGNAYNTSAEWQERRRREKERIRKKIEGADQSLKERTEARNNHFPELSSKVEDLYYSSKQGAGYRTISDKAFELYMDIDDKLSMMSSEIPLAKNLKVLESMVQNIGSSIVRYRDEPTLPNKIHGCIEELYRSYLNRIEGRFGQEIYERIHQ